MEYIKELDKCMLCPRKCMVNRNKGEVGYCLSDSRIRIANYSLHMWEEPCISGENGSGAIFFSYCNLRCIYCQNYKISKLHMGRDYCIDDVVEMVLELQSRGANNINFVTPTHYMPYIIRIIDIAKKKGLNVPVIYNTSGYENVEVIKKLKGYIDVYLPDLKYYDNDLGNKYSSVGDYFNVTKLAIDEMYNQVGKIELDSNGIIKKGVIVRHLVLPGHIEDSKKIIKYLYDTYGNNIYISIMNQFTPVNKVEYSNLNRNLSDDEYDDVVNYAYDIGVRCAYIQEDGTCTDSFIPIFE